MRARSDVCSAELRTAKRCAVKLGLRTSCRHALAACASLVPTKCHPECLESRRCCGSTERAPRRPADQERFGLAAPSAACGCSRSPGLTLCSLIFTTAMSFRAGPPLPAGTASYLGSQKMNIPYDECKLEAAVTWHRKSILWWRQRPWPCGSWPVHCPGSTSMFGS